MPKLAFILRGKISLLFFNSHDTDGLLIFLFTHKVFILVFLSIFKRME
ncbi:hypothetical protein DB44_BR00030 [Candidatus Protochlamydia amoebophila]|uniref:Uncharacterized protein n=1 Tax=Candidatus Protochlamydia amoebophila TaxID=362787 RepID=A0A0C1HE55_9BACT|nr:hypothetical protein DB44_BR00030 [Candidatus Protochlamydia amoebophila]